MSEFGEVLKEVAEQEMGKGSAAVGAVTGAVSPIVETGAVLGGVIAADAERELFDVPPVRVSLPESPFEDEDPRRPVVVQAPQPEAQPVKPLENVLNPAPVNSAPVEATAPVVEGGVK